MRGREWGYSPCWRKLLPSRENVHISSGSLISTIKSSTGSIPPHAHTHKHCILRVAHNSSAYSSVVVQKFQIFLSKIPNFEIFFNQIYIFYALQACWKFWIHILPKSRRLYWEGEGGLEAWSPVGQIMAPPLVFILKRYLSIMREKSSDVSLAS